jgi:signal transduction histidine kinase
MPDFGPMFAQLTQEFAAETASPLFPFHAIAALIFFGILIGIVWLLARASARSSVSAVLSRMQNMTMKLKEAERIGHFGSFEWDRDPQKNFWSEETFNLFGLVPGQKPPTLEKVMSMVVQEDRERAGAAFLKMQEVPGPFSVSFRILSGGSIIKYLRLEGKMILGKDKKMQKIEGVAHDITHEVEIDRAKTEFVSLASHQLKTPLTAISWLTEALLTGDKGPLNEEQRKYIENIHATDRSMMEMVNDLLNVSRIELGTLQLRPEEIDITQFAQSVVDEQKHSADIKYINIKYEYEPNLPPMRVDRNLIRMVFQNLLSNAIKYTPVGGNVSLTIARGTGMKDTVYVSVSDTGIGIPKEEQSKVFEKLHRAKNAQASVPDGTGLGLYVVKTIIERVKGAITFDSIEGKGTTFHVTLPVVWQDGGIQNNNV